jgi:hypothetical protein
MVLYNHAAHVERAGGDSSCAACHHLSMPLDRNTKCSQCHRDMYRSTSLFDHAYHVHQLGGNEGCTECHGDYAAAKNYATAKACGECHAAPAAAEPILAAPGPRWHKAASYMDAMHGLCITCHEKSIAQSPEQCTPTLGRCDTCHDADRAAGLRLMTPGGSDRRQRDIDGKQ